MDHGAHLYVESPASVRQKFLGGASLGEVALALVSVLLMATESLRSVERPRAVVTREHSRRGFWRDDLGLGHSERA